MVLYKKNIAVLCIIIITIVAGLIHFVLRHDESFVKTAVRESADIVHNDMDLSESAVFLYFCDRKRPYLVAEERLLSHSEEPVLFGRAIIEALIRGPQNGMMRTIPADTILNALYITSDKTAFIDFSQEIRESHPGGSQMEYLTVYSIINSLALNIPEIEKVKILIAGQEIETLAGHIDIRDSLSANMLLVR